MDGSVKVLITGVTGFVGSHLADYVVTNVPQAGLYGLARSSEIADHPNVAHLDDRLTLIEQDLDDSEGLTRSLNQLRPDCIFHLAARSHVRPAFANPRETLTNNLLATLNLFEAVRATELKTVILNAGSSDQYGFIEPEDLPVKESQPFRPGNPYAVSKISQEMLGYQYVRSYGLNIINTRAFNHLGPRQNPELAASAFARQLALIEAGRIPPVLKVGNLEASRDYTDVRDIVRGYWLAATSGGCAPGEPYNLCSGQDYKLSLVLSKLLELSDCRPEVEPDPALMRPSDMPRVRGDYSRFHSATGWQPIIPLDQSLNDLLAWWRTQV